MDRVTATVFVGASVDGFIARRDGGLDWLPENPEPHGYDELVAGVDAIVMGRHTFDFVVDYGGPWLYGDKRIVVLSSRTVDLSTAIGRGGRVEQMGGDPADVVARLAATGARHLYVDGGHTIQRFLSVLRDVHIVPPLGEHMTNEHLVGRHVFHEQYT